MKRRECTTIDVLLELAVDAELTEECEKTFRSPPEPESTLLPEMAYKKKSGKTDEASGSASPKVAAISAEQATKEADALTKIAQLLEKMMKSSNQSSQQPQNKTQEKGKPGPSNQPNPNAKKSEEGKKSPKAKRQFDPTKPMTCDGCGRLGYMKKYCPDCSGNEQKGG